MTSPLKIHHEVIPLDNPPYTNNCFINVIIQTLYHSLSFQQYILKQPYQLYINSPSSSTSLNPLYYLKLIFSEYKTQTQTIRNNRLITSTPFRKALSVYYPQYNPRQSGDPVELFTHIMNGIHSSYMNSPDFSSDVLKKCIPPCVAHGSFYLNLSDLTKCTRCNAVQKIQYDNNCFSYEIYIWEIFSLIADKTYISWKQSLSALYHSIATNVDNDVKVPGCSCGANAKVTKQLKLNNAFQQDFNIALSLTWSSPVAQYRELCKIYGLIQLSFNNNVLFDIDDKQHCKKMFLYSMVLFWNNHYICIIKGKKYEWHLLDDTTIKHFTKYSDVLVYCVKNKYCPVMLFYSASKEYQTAKESEQYLTLQEYNELYKFCNEKDNPLREFNFGGYNGSPIRRVSSKSIQKTNEIIQRTNSLRKNTFIRKDSIRSVDSNKCVYGYDDKWICPRCQRENISCGIQCEFCKVQKKTSSKKGLNGLLVGSDIKTMNSIVLNEEIKRKPTTLEINLDNIGNEYISSNSPTNIRKSKIEFQTKEIGYSQFNQGNNIERKVSNRETSKVGYSNSNNKVTSNGRKQSGKVQVFKTTSGNTTSKGESRSRAVNNSNKINSKQQPKYNFNFSISPVKSSNTQSSRK